MVDWILGKLKWLLIVAAVGGPVSAYIGWEDIDRVNQVMAKGVDSEATITGATRKRGKRGATSYDVDLVWKDRAGGDLKADDVRVSSAMARKLFRDDTIVIDKVRVKYLPDTPGKSGVVLTDDVSEELGLDQFMMYGGLIVGLVGILGCAWMFGLFGLLRGRKETQGQGAA